MTGKELKDFASKISDDCEVVVEVNDAPQGINLRREFHLHGLVIKPLYYKKETP